MRTILFVLTLASFLIACNKKNADTFLDIAPDYSKGEALIHVKNDSAFYYFNKVATNPGDSLLIAMAYTNMGTIQSEEGDYFGSQESLLMSLRYLNQKKETHLHCLSSDYNELAGTSLNLKNYDDALRYYDLAIKFAPTDTFQLIFLNNKAVVYQKQKEYAKAISIYNDIINKTKGMPGTYAMILSNLARTKWLQHPTYLAAPELYEALQIRTQTDNVWGQNASYSHLSDYYSRSQPDSALIYAGKMYTVAKYLQSPDDELEALQKLMQLSPPQNIKQYLGRYQYLNDSLQTARNNAKNQFALIRYEAEKNKVENLQLQKENSDKKLQIIRQQVMIYGGLLLMFSGIAITTIWYRKRKQSIIREQALKASKKVHDVVANGIYRIMKEVEYNGVMPPEILVHKLDKLYEKSRNLSYEQLEHNKEIYHIEIAQLLGDFKSPTRKVITIGNDKQLWENTNIVIREEVASVLQELMVNMEKHSAANNVILKFEKGTDEIKINYTDDGIGFPPEIKKGNGLTNTVSRISDIGGNVKFATDVTKGAKIQISFPIPIA